MAILEIKLLGCPALRSRCAPIEERGEAFRGVVSDMFDTMYNGDGIGLAGPQVGVMARVIVVDVNRFDPSLKPFALLNPDVVAVEGKQTGEEGCLSIPDVVGEVCRANRIRVRGIHPDGAPSDFETSGLGARVVLHEIDHLNGVLFLDHLSSVRRYMLRGALRKIRKTGRRQTEATKVLEIPVATPSPEEAQGRATCF